MHLITSLFYAIIIFSSLSFAINNDNKLFFTKLSPYANYPISCIRTKDCPKSWCYPPQKPKCIKSKCDCLH